MSIKLFVLAFALLLLLFIITRIRNHQMTFKYALSWLLGCSGVIFFTIKDNYLARLSEFLGFALPSNFIFFLLLLFVIALSLALSIYINEQSIRTEKLSQELAILKEKVGYDSASSAEDS